MDKGELQLNLNLLSTHRKMNIIIGYDVIIIICNVFTTQLTSIHL